MLLYRTAIPSLPSANSTVLLQARSARPLSSTLLSTSARRYYRFQGGLATPLRLLPSRSNGLVMSDFVPPPVFPEHRTASMSSSSAQASATDASKDPTTEAQTGTQITSHNQYDTAGLSSSDLLPFPLALFQRWFESAQGQNVHEPEAMLLSTVASSPTDGTPRPSSRVVLLKEIHPKEGLTFYTNYTSRKGRELQQNPHAAATFYWRETSQSVRFCGRVRRVEKVESQKYFDSRPVGSRVGAHASPQSTRVGSREELEERVRAKEHELGVPGAAGLEGKEAGKKWEDKKLEVPEYWGGYRIEPYEVEFWCGRPNRLHDRFRYTRDENSKKLAGEDEWVVERLAP